MSDFKTKSLIEPLQKAVKLGKEFIAGAEKTNIKLAKTAELISKFAKGLDLKSATGLKEFNDELARTNDLVKLKKENTKQLNTAEKDLLKNQKDLSAELIKEEKILREKIKTQQVLSAGERKASIENEKNAIQRVNKAKQEETLSQQKIRTANLLIAQKKRENAEIEKGIKQKALENKKLIESTSFYKKVTSSVNKARAEYKELAAQFGFASTQAKKALNRFKQLDNGLRRINDAARDGTRDVGRYGIALKGIGSNLIGGLGIVGGVQLFAQGLKETFNIVKNFSSAQSELAGILGKNKDEITDLTEVIKDLGSSTSFTATEVTKAATALAKLGFGTDKIKASLKGVLDGAVAFGVSIEDSADLTAKSLNSFQLSADETDRVVSTLAVSTTKSANSFAFLNDALPFAATGARLLGQSIEETTAQIGILADNNVKASIAGTSLRKIFATLNREGLTLRQALDKINNSSNKSKTAFDLFGATDADTGVILAENIEKTDKLTKSITNQKDALDKLVATRLDNLEGDVELLSSAWEGLVLALDDGNGVFTRVIRAIIQGATGLIGIFTRASSIIGVFIDKLSVEFEPVVNLVRKLFSYFGDFNVKGSLTELILARLVIGFKVLILPIRLLFQNILLLKDAFDIVTNEGKKFLNFLGGDFEVNPKINTDKIIKRFAEIKDVIVDTFTYSDIDTKKIEDSLKTVTDKLKGKGGKGGEGGEGGDNEVEVIGAITAQRKEVARLRKAKDDSAEKDLFNAEKALASAQKELKRLEDIGKSIDDRKKKERELTGAIEKQRLVVNEISQDKERAKKKDLAGLEVLLTAEKAKLKELEELGKPKKETKSVRDDSQFELDKYRLEQELVIYDEYTEERKKKEIEFIEFKRDYTLEQEGLTEAEIILIKEKANQEILDLDKRYEDKRIADAKKREDELQKFLKDSYAKTINFLSDLYDQLNKRKIEGIEREVEAGVKNQELINKGINEGSKIGEQSLALEKKQQEDRESELIRLENKALKLKAFIAILEVWGATGSAGEALAGFAKVKGVADGAFYEGTDYVGEGQETKVHNGKDGYVGMLNKGEIVFNNKEADEARELGYTTRDSMMNLMRMASTGVSGGSSVEVVMNDNTRLINVMEENNRLLAKLPSQMSTHNTGLTDDPRYIEEVIKKANITNRAKRRANGSWSNR